MGNLNINLDGYVNQVLEYMIREGYSKTKTEAVRLALFDFDRSHGILPEEETAFEVVAQKILGEVESGKQRTKKFSLKELE
jgi:hypothetical protein